MPKTRSKRTLSREQADSDVAEQEDAALLEFATPLTAGQAHDDPDLDHGGETTDYPIARDNDQSAASNSPVDTDNGQLDSGMLLAMTEIATRVVKELLAAQTQSDVIISPFNGYYFAG